MKLLSYVAVCVFLLLSISSCQKNDSPDPTDQKPTADTLLTRLVTIDPYGNGTYTTTYDFDYDSLGRLVKYIIDYGDTTTNFTYDQSGNLTGFTDIITHSIYGSTPNQVNTYTIQYNGNKILVTDNWHTPTRTGVDTYKCTLKDGLIVELIMESDKSLGYPIDTLTNVYNTFGNIVESGLSSNKVWSVATFDYYKNPFLIKSAPIFTAVFFGGDLSKNLWITSINTGPTAGTGIIQDTIKQEVLEHIGSYPTKMTALSRISNFTYSFRNR